MTIDDLAVIVKHGFDAVDKRFEPMATKDDLKRFATKGDLKDIADELNATHADVRYIRSRTDALVRSDIAEEAAITDLTTRVHRLEQKAGFAK